MDPNQAVHGEQVMSASDMQDLVPDLVSSKGKQIVQSFITKASGVKPKLDNTLKLITQQVGLDSNKDFESRIKNPDTIIKKVAIHRKDGKDEYRVNNVNDIYGARFIVNTPEQKKEIVKLVEELDKNNWMKIDKQEQVDHGTYHAYHIDFNKDGVKGEIQIHDPHSLFESVMNHGIRSTFGEKPSKSIEEIKHQNKHIGEKMPMYTAQQVAQTIEKYQQKGVNLNG